MKPEKDNNEILETSLHLYQPVHYSHSQRDWLRDYSKVIFDGEKKLTFDISAILSILAFNFPCGDRTLFHEIKRQPWLSSISEDGKAVFEQIPPHDYFGNKPAQIAARLNTLLREEAECACHNRDEIYILLSGGLDSRIVAGILYELREKGALKGNPICLTWGIEDSRDVQYAKATAEMLGFGWKHINIGAEAIIENIHEGFPLIGGLVPPAHLHRMLWFKNNISKEALVLAGSYGDSIGRAEFSGRHVLELDFLRPYNPFNLIRQDCLKQAVAGLHDDLRLLHERVGHKKPQYALCEIEMQCHYMRGMIAHVMDVVNNWCTLYQMFTDPKVYTYIWSLHPSRRDDNIYAALLEDIHPGLARLPWARTNRALRGRTVGAQKKLYPKFHDYAHWTSNVLYDEILKIVDPDWYESIGIFNAEQVRFLNKTIALGPDSLKGYGFKAYDIWLWLAGFRKMIESFQAQNFSLHTLQQKAPPDIPLRYFEDRLSLRRQMSNIKVMRKTVSYFRKRIMKIEALNKWPIKHKMD